MHYASFICIHCKYFSKDHRLFATTACARRLCACCKVTSCSNCKTVSANCCALKGLAFGDKGYICKKLFDSLLQNGLKLITRERKNMKPAELNSYEKQLLNQRNLIEMIIDPLKHHYQVWHTRHRSVINAMTHLVAALAAYTIEPLNLSAIKLIAET